MADMVIILTIDNLQLPKIETFITFQKTVQHGVHSLLVSS